MIPLSTQIVPLSIYESTYKYTALQYREYSAAQSSKALYYTALCYTTKHSAVPCSIVQCSIIDDIILYYIILYYTLPYYTMLYSSIEYSKEQHYTIHPNLVVSLIQPSVLLLQCYTNNSMLHITKFKQFKYYLKYWHCCSSW